MSLFSFFAPLKTSEIQKFSDVFSGYTKITVVGNGLVYWMLCSVCSKLTLMACWGLSRQDSAQWPSVLVVNFEQVIVCSVLQKAAEFYG